MEPKHSMTTYAVGLATALLAVIAVRIWPLALALAMVDLLAGISLARSYRRWMGDVPPPEQRLPLDRLVRRQWASAGGVGLLTAIGVGAVGVHVVDRTTAVEVLQAVATASAVALSAVFVSSLVDWYWILPRVGGLGDHRAPCEDPGERWKYPTAIWLLHRGLATALVVASIAAVPFYLAGVLGNPATKVVLSVVGVAIGGGMAALNQKGLASIANAFNQPFYVGDTILVNQAGEGEGAPVRRRRAYVVDVSVQGLKYQYLDGYEYGGPRFERKGHGPVEAVNQPLTIDQVNGPLAAPCRHACTGVNWYCRNNARAYDQ